MASFKQPVSSEPRGVRIVLVLVLGALLSGVIFLAIRHRQTLPPVLPEVHRDDLELRGGTWFTKGDTNKFTGVLFETYEDGAIKSRSIVSNGLLEGLSEGWWTNGVIQVSEYFSNGISHGERTKYYLTGKTLSVAMIVDGKVEGQFESWHENGHVAEQVYLNKGVPHGESVAYHPDGTLKAKVRLNQGKVIEQEFWEPGKAPADALTINR